MSESDDRRDDRQQRQREADDGPEHVVDALGLSADRADARRGSRRRTRLRGRSCRCPEQHEAEHEHEERHAPWPGLPNARATPASVVDERAEQPEDRRRGSERHVEALRIGQRKSPPSNEVSRKPSTPAGDVDDDHPARAVQLARRPGRAGGSIHVEKNVEQSCRAASCRQDRPPAMQVEDRERRRSRRICTVLHGFGDEEVHDARRA